MSEREEELERGSEERGTGGGRGVLDHIGGTGERTVPAMRRCRRVWMTDVASERGTGGVTPDPRSN